MFRRRPKFKYEVCYIKIPYGRKSKILKRECEPATSKKDAEEWKKTLKKHKVWNITIKKLPKKEWF